MSAQFSLSPVLGWNSGDFLSVWQYFVFYVVCVREKELFEGKENEHFVCIADREMGAEVNDYVVTEVEKELARIQILESVCLVQHTV